MLQAARESYRVLYLGGRFHTCLDSPLNPGNRRGAFQCQTLCVEMNEQLTQQAAVRAWEDACSKSLQRWTRNMIHAPSMYFPEERAFRQGFAGFFGSRASYHGPHHQSTIRLEAKPTMKIRVPPELLMKNKSLPKEFGLFQ